MRKVEKYRYDSVSDHLELLVKSYERLTGKILIEYDQLDTLPILFEKVDFALVSHGTEEDPVFNYGNRCALELFEMSFEELTNLPSRKSAELPNREERARLLAEVTAKGYIENYSGVRISATGKRFQIEEATVWNLINAKGDYCGQAAVFSKWVMI